MTDDGMTVIYDPDCGFCARVRAILEDEPAYVPLTFMPYGGTATRARFPGLCSGPKPELIVVDAQGGVYLETKAYLMCLYASRTYRALALRLASPAMLPFARQAFAWLGRNRHLISRLLGLRSERALAAELGARPAPACVPSPGPR
jgi:predicted DCC family thiol-disulfide oxidoreductase YuxK